MILELLTVIIGICFVASSIFISKKERTLKFFIACRAEFIEVSDLIDELKDKYNYTSLMDHFNEPDRDRKSEKLYKNAREKLYNHVNLLVILYIGIKKVYDISIIKLHSSFIKKYHCFIKGYLCYNRALEIEGKKNEQFNIELDRLVKIIS